jgi:hypothetical protein
MIDDLDRTIEELLKRELPAAVLDRVAISFATPDSDFPNSVTFPAVNFFLYDIRENLELRNTDWMVERDSNGMAMRKRAPVRIDCSYLVTAWSSEGSNTRPFDEHRILSSIIRALIKYPTIPEQILQNSLRGQEPPLPTAALQPARLGSPSEFWQSLGGRPKAALNYTVTIGLAVDAPIELEVPVIDKRLQFPRIAVEER